MGLVPDPPTELEQWQKYAVAMEHERDTFANLLLQRVYGKASTADLQWFREATGLPLVPPKRPDGSERR